MTTHTSATPQAVERVRASFARQGLMAHLGAELVEVAAGLVRIGVAARTELTQQHGYLHAGVTAAIADSAGGYAALTLFEPDQEVLTVDYTINLTAPAAGEHFEATGTVLRAGRTLTVCQFEVHALSEGSSALVAAGQQTLIRLPSPKMEP